MNLVFILWGEGDEGENCNGRGLVLCCLLLCIQSLEQSMEKVRKDVDNQTSLLSVVKSENGKTQLQQDLTEQCLENNVDLKEI